MYTIQGILIQLLIFVLIVVTIVVMTYRSSLSSDKKIAVSVVTIFMPVLGLILFFIFRRKSKIQTT